MELKKYQCTEVPEIRVQGRISTRKTDGIPLFWTGSAIEFNVTGSEARLEYECVYDKGWIGHNESYIRIEIDGADMYRFMLEEGIHTVNIFRGFSDDAVKNVRIFRETQASHTIVKMKAIYTNGEFRPVPKRMKIELLGDSVTSGEGLAGAKCHNFWTPAIFSSRGEYGIVTANALDADWSIVAMSGFGFYCDWQNNIHNVIPASYEYVCGTVKSDELEALGASDIYDFENSGADITVVNLGSNDGGALGGKEYVDKDGTVYKIHAGEDGKPIPEDAEKLSKAVYETLSKIRKYNPKTKIVWCYNMLNDKLNDLIVSEAENYKKMTGDGNVFTLELPRSPAELVGARSHPGIGAHKLFADALTKKIEEILKI